MTASAQQIQSSSSGSIGTVLPQVAPGQQQNNNNGRGISFVTRPTPTAANASLARGFFAAGGVNLGGNGAIVTTPGANSSDNSSVIARTAPQKSAIPSNAELSRIAAAAQRGDARAQARLVEIGRAMTEQPIPASTVSSPAAPPSTAAARTKAGARQPAAK
jgi:hypothetical protein